MFKFTTTSIINSVKYLDTETARFKAVGDKFKVNHNSIIIEKDNVMAAYKREAFIGQKAKCVISGLDAVTGDIVRVKIYVRLAMSDQDSYYANDLVYKGKPFIFEFKKGATDAEVLKIANEIATMENVQLTFTSKGKKISEIETPAAIEELEIEGKKATQILKSVEIEEWDPEVKTTYPGQVGAFVPSENATIDETKTIPAVEAFGTYAYLMKDLVLPTYENIRWAGQQVDEKPIPGATYTQYIVHICKNRGIMGGDAVGEASKSITTHIFWVNDAIKDAFETAIEGIVTFSKYTGPTGTTTPVEGVKTEDLPDAVTAIEDAELVEADLVEKKTQE